MAETLAEQGFQHQRRPESLATQGFWRLREAENA
jgi:hypothetical protein